MLRTHVAAPLFVGRKEELTALRGLLEQARAGTGSMALIGGEAGFGKTRLCRELKNLAAASEVRVIEGRSSAAESNVPYGPFVDALRFRIARGESDTASQVLQPIIANVAPLFSALSDPSSAELQPRTTSAPFESIFVVLKRLTSLGPVMMIIEDLHWADATSRDLVHYIARRVQSLPMLVVATYRTDEAQLGAPLNRLIASLAREPATVRIDLEPLEPWDVAALVESLMQKTPEPDLVVAIYDRTEGNPLFVEERISALLRECGDFKASDILRASAPETLHEIVWERLSCLSDEVREALTVGAVTGRRFRFDVVAAALQWPEDRLLSAIESLIEHRLIVEVHDESEETYSFRHSLVQEVLYNSTIGRRRRFWHRRVAAAIEQIGSGSEALPHTVLAHHYNLGGDMHKARVHTVLAGDEAARLCAWKEAESMYEAALAALAREGNDAATEADILERLVETAWWQNRIDAVEAYSREALTIRRNLGDSRHAAGLLRRLANLDAYQRGDIESALARLQEANDLLVNIDTAERAYVLNDLGRLRVRRGDWEEAGALFEQSLSIGGKRADCTEEALSLVMLGWLAVHAGQVSTGLHRLELARVLLDEHEIPLDRGAEVYHAGIRALEAAREHQRAREWVDAAIVFAEKHSARGDLAVYRAYQAAVQRRAGEWDAALFVAGDAVAELRSTGRAELREALRILGDLQRGRGQVGLARASYEEAMRLGERSAAIGEALLLVAEEQWDEAALRMHAALKAYPWEDKLFALRVLPLLVEAHAMRGALPEATEQLRRLNDLVNASDYRAGKAARAQATGMLAKARGDANAATRHLGEAIAIWAELDLPYETARAKLLLAAHVNGKEGLELAGEAARTFEELGATLDVSRAHSLLRSAGIRVRRKTQTASAPVPQALSVLSPRELEIVAELARGCTNKQIARTLSLSPRTVGNHVSSILAKLGCGTRTEVSRIVLTS